MKKIIGLFSLLILLTGCGSNRLTCKMEVDGTGYRTQSSYTYVFDGENIKKATQKTTVELTTDDENGELLTYFQQAVARQVDSLNQIDGFTASYSLGENKIVQNLEILVAGVSDSNKETYALNLEKEELKSQMEKNGYTCK